MVENNDQCMLQYLSCEGRAVYSIHCHNIYYVIIMTIILDFTAAPIVYVHTPNICPSLSILLIMKTFSTCMNTGIQLITAASINSLTAHNYILSGKKNKINLM